MGAAAQPIRRVLAGALRRAAVAALLEVGVIALIALINPFHVDQWEQQRSRAVWQRIMADNYGTGHWETPKPTVHGADRRGPPQSLEGIPPISVVYLDEASLKQTSSERALPESLSVSEQRYLLQDVTGRGTIGPGSANQTPAKPVAVFVDIDFAGAAPGLAKAQDAIPSPDQVKTVEDACNSAGPGRKPDPFSCYVASVAKVTHYDRWGGDRQCQVGALAKLACILSTGGVPIIFGAAQEVTLDNRVGAQPAAIQALNEVALIAPTTFEEEGYPLAPDHYFDQPSEDVMLPPASVLYAAYCWHFQACATAPVSPDGALNLDFSPGADEAARASSLRALRWAQAFEPRVEVNWGFGRDAYGEILDRVHGRARNRCRPAKPGFPSLLVALLSQAAPSVASLRGASQAEPTPCAYAPDIPYADFDDNMTLEDKRSVLDGKVVIVAGQYRSSGDWLPALDSSLPGAQYHAMALANLIDNNSGYPKVNASLLKDSTLNRETAYSIVAVFLVNLAGGIALMLLNEPGLDPKARWRAEETPKTRFLRLMRPAWIRWVTRALIALTPALLFAGVIGIMVECLHNPFYDFEIVIVASVVALGSFRLAFAAARPAFEKFSKFFESFEISNARIFDHDPESRSENHDAAQTENVADV